MDFTLPSASGYVVTISEDGLSKLSLDGITVGEGPAILLDGSWFYRPFDQAGYTPTLASKSAIDIPNGVEVEHAYTGLLSATVKYQYTVSGNNVHVKAHVTNTGSKSLQPAFRSMRFFRDAVIDSNLTLDYNHTQASGEVLSYPSFNVPLGATYVSSKTTSGAPVNYAVWSEEDPEEKYMTLGVGVGAFPGQALASVFFHDVPPGGSRIYRWAYRFLSHTGDWKMLLAGYKSRLRTAFPTLNYDLNARPMVQFASIDNSYIRPDNPYGYNDNGDGITRRFDKLEGCQDYVAKLVVPMTTTGYQGIIFWQPQGINPRGVQYRPDFDVFPPVTIPNLPTIVAGFRDVGLKIGLLARPGIVVTSGTWDADGSVRITDYEESALDIKWRLDWALAREFNSFYLDSFVGQGHDHGILRLIREAIGGVETFAEFSTALSIPLSASYAELRYQNGAFSYDKRRAILSWIYPESIWLTKFIGPLPPGGYQQVYDFMFANKLTPLVEDYRAWVVGPGTENAILQPLVASYIGADGRWL